MNFSIRSRMRYTAEGQAEPFAVFEHQQHNMLFLPCQTTRVECQPDEEIECISITLAPEFLRRLLPDDHPILKHLHDSLGDQQPARISHHNLPITATMLLLLREILHSRHQGYFKRLYLEARVIELMLLQIEQYEQLPAHSGEPVIPEEDIKKMYLAKDILVRHLEDPLSLTELARQVGTNGYYLKKNFKRVFGTTVFGYLHTFKMEQAKKLLRQEDKKIAEVARRVGYKHATHFTAAFKKHFGFLPHEVRT